MKQLRKSNIFFGTLFWVIGTNVVSSAAAKDLGDYQPAIDVQSGEGIASTQSFVVPQDCVGNTDSMIDYIASNIRYKWSDYSVLKEGHIWNETPITKLDQLIKLSLLEEEIQNQGQNSFQFGIKKIEISENVGCLNDKVFQFILDHTAKGELPANNRLLKSLHLPGLNNAVEQVELLLSNINENSIESLDLSNSQLPETFCFSEAFCNSLKSLNLSNCTGISSDNWGEFYSKVFPNMEMLNLEGCAVNEQIIQLIENSPNLKRLNLSNCENISDGNWHAILQHLNHDMLEIGLNGARFEDSIIEPLARFSSLEKLSFNNVTGIDQDWATIIDGLPANIRYLSLAGMPLNEDTAQALTRFTHLVYLNLTDCKALAEGTWEEKSSAHQASKVLWISILNSIPHTLEELYLNNTSVSDLSIGDVYIRLNGLKVLSLSGCKSISEEALFVLLGRITDKLQYLSLSDTQFTGYGAEYFNRLQNLKTLYLGSCKIGFHDKIVSNPRDTYGVYIPKNIHDDDRNPGSINLWAKIKSRHRILLSALPTSLEVLDLTDTCYTGESIELFSRLENLKSLSLSKNEFRKGISSMFPSQKQILEKWAPLLEVLPVSLISINIDDTDCPSAVATLLKGDRSNKEMLDIVVEGKKDTGRCTIS